MDLGAHQSYRVAWSHAARDDILRKKRDKLRAGYVAGDDGVAGISAHSSPTGLRGVTLSEMSRFHLYCKHSSKQRMETQMVLRGVTLSEMSRFHRYCKHVKKGKRGACRQKAATVLPDRTAAT